jgi:hypothetical protein
MSIAGTVQTYLNVTFDTIKTILTTIPSYYVPQGDGGYEVYAIGDSISVRSVIEDATDDKTEFEATYKNNCTQVASADDALIRGLVANKVPFVQPRTDDGRLRTASEKPLTTRTNFYSHDFCDKTTWYQNAVRVVDEVAEDTGDHLTYQLDHEFVIDSYHGKITGEDGLKSAADHSYRVTVKINGTTKVERDPHLGSVGDYTINYDDGQVTFFSALDPADEVKVTYHYATNSKYTVKPTAGRKLLLELAEVQFSQDINPMDSVVFEARGIANYFVPPAYIGNNPGQIPSGTVITLQQFVYKAISDFHNDAFKSYPSYAAMGAPDNWRSQLQPVTVFDWDYLSATTLDSSKGMEIVVYLQHDIPYEGYMATATFYCKSENE